MKHLIFILAITICSAISSLACDCVIPTGSELERSKYFSDAADTVFSGKVVGFEYRKDIPNADLEERKLAEPTFSYETRVIKVEVLNWWKFELPKIVFLRTARTKTSDNTVVISSCDFSLEEGKSYLIYAKKRDAYFSSSSCSGNQDLKAATSFLSSLGPGNKPKE